MGQSCASGAYHLQNKSCLLPTSICTSSIRSRKLWGFSILQDLHAKPEDNEFCADLGGFKPLTWHKLTWRIYFTWNTLFTHLSVELAGPSDGGKLEHHCCLLLLTVIWALNTFKRREKDFTFVAQHITVRVVVGCRAVKSKDFCMIK